MHWQSVKQRICFNTLKFIHKIEAGKAPGYMEKYMKKKQENPTVTT
jgi:hypothetical protein